MNKRHLKNLEKLADFLETEVTDKQFDIRVYLAEEDGSLASPNQILPECGTVGCALGWSTALFYKQSLKYYDWGTYSDKMFGCSVVTGGVWDYMFRADQSKSQSTRKSTIKRIRKVVANRGELP